MIIDMSTIRRKGDNFINNIIFEMRMKGYKINKKEAVSIIPTAGFMFINSKPGYDGIHSYEIMNSVMTTGDIIGALTFGLFPILQTIQINDINMINTYVKARKCS